jgi:hypothetical protein
MMRHSWNPDNTLAQWRERFAEDLHSKIMPVGFQTRGAGCRLLTQAGLDTAGPLPPELPWGPTDSKRVGCERMGWP